MEIFVLRWCLGNSGKGMNVPEMTFDVANENVNILLGMRLVKAKSRLRARILF